MKSIIKYISKFFSTKQEFERIKKIIVAGDQVSVLLLNRIRVDGYIYDTSNPKKLKLHVSNVTVNNTYNQISVEIEYIIGSMLDDIEQDGFVYITPKTNVLNLKDAKLVNMVNELGNL